MAEKCHEHTAVLIYSMLEDPPTERGGWRLTEGAMGGFIYFTVLKDVRDAMNLSVLPTSCIKNVYCTCLFLFFNLF